MVIGHLILDNFYICTCIKGGDIILNCRDSFCKGCFGKFLYKEEFYGKCYKYLNEIFGYGSANVHIWLKRRIKCPKCLLISKIGNLIKQCSIYSIALWMHIKEE